MKLLYIKTYYLIRYNLKYENYDKIINKFLISTKTYIIESTSAEWHNKEKIKQRNSIFSIVAHRIIVLYNSAYNNL